METTKKASKAILWTSYVLQLIIVIMLLMGAVQNLMQSEMAVKGATDMGYPESSVLYLGVVLLFATLLYAIPRTTILGAILLTAWLGGAVATHIIHKDPLLNLLFPVLFGIFVWLSVWLRNKTLKEIFPFKN